LIKEQYKTGFLSKLILRARVEIKKAEKAKINSSSGTLIIVIAKIYKFKRTIKKSIF